MVLIFPRFVAVDSSILASWSHDASASDPKLRDSARDVQRALFEANWIPILCLHHFIELIRHSDLRIGALRIEFLRSFSQIAWLGRSYDQFMLGSVVDVFEAEVAAIVDCPDISLAGMRQSVKAKLVQYGPPSMLRYMYDWEWQRGLQKFGQCDKW